MSIPEFLLYLALMIYGAFGAWINNNSEGVVLYLVSILMFYSSVIGLSLILVMKILEYMGS